MEEKEIEVNGKKIKVAIKLPKDYIEDNTLKVFLDNTIDLEKIIKEIKSNTSDEKEVELINED